MDYEMLMRVGLTEGEAKVYLALMETGSSSVGNIVKKSGVAYSNVYEILERLIKKGLVSFVIKSKTKYFQALEPRRFYDFLEKKEKEIKKERKVVDEIVPKLAGLSKMKGERLEAEVFVGLKGMYTAYEKLIMNCRPGGEYIFFYGPEREAEMMVDRFFLNMDKFYRKNNVTAKGILNEYYYKNSGYLKKSPLVKTEEMNVRHVSFPVPGNIDVCGGMTLIASWSGPMLAFLIHSNNIAERFRRYFRSVWKNAKK